MGTTRNTAIMNNMLALIVEATEVLETVHWKPWHRIIKETDTKALREEIADCLLFVYNAAYEAGLDPKELAIIAACKQARNTERF